MHEGSYFTYIMASRSHTLYIGVTGELLKRVFQHKWKEHEGSRQSTTAIDWCGSKRSRNLKGDRPRKELKGWRRAKKIALIESLNPAWTDLSREWYDCEPADYRRSLDRVGQ